MKVGDRVGLKYDPGDLRQPLGIGHMGTVVSGPWPDGKGGEWWFVHFDGQETAMRMWERELEVLSQLTSGSS